MDYPQPGPVMPADYYRRHAARVRQLAGEATTPAVKDHLQEVAGEYERLAERVDAAAPLEGSSELGPHRFAVGQTVRFSPDRNDRHQLGSGQGRFKIVRLLPAEASVLQYRVKSQADGHERVVREDQLARS
jgi:hypothetical protein